MSGLSGWLIRGISSAFVRARAHITLNSSSLQRIPQKVGHLKYSVVIERDVDGVYVASIPELPGCHTQARNLDELTSRIREAAELCLEEMGSEGERREFIGARAWLR